MPRYQLRRPLPHVVPATDHPTQKSLALLDPTLELWFNKKLGRYELWRYEMTPIGKTYGFIRRVVDDERTQGFAEPGEWFVTLMKARDPRHRPAKEVAALYIKELDEHNAKAERAREAAFDEQLSNISREYAPIFMRKIKDDNLFGRFFRGFRRSEA